MLARIAPRLLATASASLAPLARPTLRCMSSVSELASALSDEIDFEVRGWGSPTAVVATW